LNINKSPRINREIRETRIRLIDDKGEMRGIVSLGSALILAKELGMDLVEVSPNVEPSVCKVLDYGRYKYEMQKKQSVARKSQKLVEIKEIKVRPNIDEHDYQVKMRSIEKFIKAGNKVKITLRFRGREMVHQDLGLKLLFRIRDSWSDYAKLELEPKTEGRQMIMILVPRSN